MPLCLSLSPLMHDFELVPMSRHLYAFTRCVQALDLTFTDEVVTECKKKKKKIVINRISEAITSSWIAPTQQYYDGVVKTENPFVFVPNNKKAIKNMFSTYWLCGSNVSSMKWQPHAMMIT